MRAYQIFGGSLRSDLEFPDLTSGRNDGRGWTLRIAAAPARPALELLGADQVHEGCAVRLFADAAGFRLVYDDTGSFDVSADGAEILWTPGAAASPDDARLDVIGRVLALAMHASGVLDLHGSAVALAEGGVTFLAPKGAGKSTLAFALARAGARFLGDDTIPVEPPAHGAPAMMRPGVLHARLRTDAARRLLATDPGRLPAGDKHVIAVSDRGETAGTATPLRAIYLLAPMPADRPPVRRVVLSPVAAALALVRHAKLGPLLGGRAAAPLLDAAAAVATATPVYALEVARDFERLDRVVEQLLAWHGGAAIHAAAEPGLAREGAA